MTLPSHEPLNPLSCLRQELAAAIVPERLLDDPLSTMAHAGDASFYRLIPRLVIRILNEKEASAVLAACSRYSSPVTFRAAGTSLSGQALSDSVLMTMDRGFSRAEVLDEGRRIRLQPALIGSAANRLLAPYGRKIGPDPASIDSAMIGGIAANNASGMCCGTTRNCYRTLDSLRVVLADGTILDTSDSASRRAFASSHESLLAGLTGLASEAQADAGLRELIARKHRIKNTIGYGLNALIDFQDPFDILQHLLIGSEGTLGFISEITLHTVPDPPRKAAILAFFPDAAASGRAAVALAKAPVEALEYMDQAALEAVSGHPQLATAGVPMRACALLIDVRGTDAGKLKAHLDAVRGILAGLQDPVRVLQAEDETQYGGMWSIRKGLFPAIGSMRPPGTTVVIEDVAFPIHRLPEALVDLRRLLDESGYPGAIIYGHALAGNLHFVFWQEFGKAQEVERYAALMERLANLVLEQYGGSLKAEHGTGRNMAPFVEREWGRQAYGLMRRIKALFDPQGILNPDVILSSDPRIHLKHLKPMPMTHPLVDSCIECGFCESVCPSRNLTMTPRQRIAVRREISRLQGKAPGSGRAERTREESLRLSILEKDFVYAGERTCATDGLCAGKCPVGIDTGALIKSLRKNSHGPLQNALAGFAARHFGMVLAGTRVCLRLYHGLRNLPGGTALPALLRVVTRWMPDRFPQGLAYLPDAAAPTVPPPFGTGKGRRVVYFPSCINRTFGPQRKSDPPLPEVMVSLLLRAGFEVAMPPGLAGLCCGLAFSSKGFESQGEDKLREMRLALAAAAGMDDVVCDASPCSQRLARKLGDAARIHDSADFLAGEVLPRLSISKRQGTVALHPPCSLARVGGERSLALLAAACAERVVIPEGMSCCGVAGDRLFAVPELPASACAPLRTGLPEGCAEGYSTSRTCEMGLSASAGIPYRSIPYLLFETTAKDDL